MENLSPSQRLVKYGFMQGHAKESYLFDKKKKVYKPKGTNKFDASHAEEESVEEVNLNTRDKYTKFLNTGYPKPYRRHKLVVEAPNMDIQETYFWILNHIRQDQSFPYVDKITDIFSASENSAFFGQSAQRLGIQQDRASQYLATIGKMVKDVFPLIRELRIIDERLEAYYKSDTIKSADVTLKGLYVDLVEGGTKSPASVFGLAQQLGFVSLPDIFFNTHIKKVEDIDKIVDGIKAANIQVKNVLKRKMFAYMTWKEKTQKEQETRKQYTLKYLRQHWMSIKMYMSWVKPYLKNVRRLSMNQQQQDSPDLIGAFETSLTEIEFLARKPLKDGVWAVIIATFNYQTKPSMDYNKDFQRGPVHIGKVSVSLRAYGWTDEQIENYKRMKQEEDMYLLGSVDDAIQESMDAFGEELDKYLKEAGAYVEEKEELEDLQKKQDNSFKQMADPFVSVGKGFGELFGAFVPIKISKSDKKKDLSGLKKEAAASAYMSVWLAYKLYKKSHGLLSW